MSRVYYRPFAPTELARQSPRAYLKPFASLGIIQYLHSMKSANQLTGKQGEELAAQYLIGKGYRILERNFRAEGCETDIIAQLPDGLTVIFAEVKTRRSFVNGFPEKAVNALKADHLRISADAWLDANQWTGEIRFDVIAIILLKNQPPEIYHIPDAIVYYPDSYNI